MRKGLKLDGQLRALAIALGGAVVMSVVAMLVPVGLWETITGSTGISELVPATAAPLGDTARAMIAFLFGAGTFAVLALLLLRRPAQVPAQATAKAPAKPAAENAEAVAPQAEGETFVAKMRGRISDFVESRRNGVVITELSDLPKLRPGDAHPDAPPRRPISAHRDFALVEEEPATPIVEEPLVETPAEPMVAEEPVVAAVIAPQTVSMMVDRLEGAVVQRQAELARLEALARSEIEKPEPGKPEPVAERVEAEIMPAAPSPPVLEAVPSEPAKAARPDEMDAALRSALETLHRMNARTR
jgi:hypothetical protein